MNVSCYLLLIAVLFYFNTPYNSNYDIIEIPLKFENGYGSLPAGFRMLNWQETKEDDPWYITESSVTGVPDNWNTPIKKAIWMDGKQFVYQHYKQGNISETRFEELVVAWNIKLKKRIFVDHPIKCFVNVIYGKDSNGNTKYKIDTDNDLDFLDEVEFSPAKMEFSKLDSLVTYNSHQISYQAIRNQEIVNLTAPILILEDENGRLLCNIPQHGIADFQGNKLKISSQGFQSTSYDPVSISKNNKNEFQEIIEENEYISINGDVYQNLGVNIDKEILLLKRMPKDTTIYSTQVGFKAKGFIGKDFATHEEIDLEMYSGKFLYLEFWGSWCGPCIKELPNIKTAYHHIDKTKIDFLGIALDNADALKKLIDKEKIEWKQILQESEDGIIDDYNIQGYPTSFLIDPTGKIIAKNIRGEKLLDSLNYYLK